MQCPIQFSRAVAFSYAKRRGRQESDADEIGQEAAVARIEQESPHENEEVNARTHARNKFIDRLRRDGVRRRYVESARLHCARQNSIPPYVNQPAAPADPVKVAELHEIIEVIREVSRRDADWQKLLEFMRDEEADTLDRPPVIDYASKLEMAPSTAHDRMSDFLEAAERELLSRGLIS